MHEVAGGDWFSFPFLSSANRMLIRTELSRKHVWAERDDVKWIRNIHLPLLADTAVFKQTPERLISGSHICLVWLLIFSTNAVTQVDDLFHRGPVSTSTLQQANTSYSGRKQVEHSQIPTTVLLFHYCCLWWDAPGLSDQGLCQDTSISPLKPSVSIFPLS